MKIFIILLMLLTTLGFSLARSHFTYEFIIPVDNEVAENLTLISITDKFTKTLDSINDGITSRLETVGTNLRSEVETTFISTREWVDVIFDDFEENVIINIADKLENLVPEATSLLGKVIRN